jgi:probable rRNA maturation factor
VRHLGDVAISVARARRQAAAYGHSFERELGYLLTHGVLHLVGFDHEADADQAEMRRVEEQALATVGLGREAEPGLGASA